MAMRYYSSQAVETSLTAPISDTATSMTVAAVTGYPTSTPFTVTLEQGTSSEEIVDVVQVSGNTWTIVRGVDGSSALPHSAGAKVVHTYTARDARESKVHQEATSGVHGLQVGDTVVGEQATQTLANKTLSNPAITSPTVSGGTWSDGTLDTPIIGDYSRAQHDHSSASAGGAIPQASVTGLPTRLTAIESTNAAQGETLDDHEQRIQAVEPLVGKVAALENGIISNSFKFHSFSPSRVVNSSAESELTQLRQTFDWQGVVWPPNASRLMVHFSALQAGSTDARYGAKLNGTPFGYYGLRLIGAASTFSTGEMIYQVWDVPLDQLVDGQNVFSYWAWKDQSNDPNFTISSTRTWMTLV